MKRRTIGWLVVCAASALASTAHGLTVRGMGTLGEGLALSVFDLSKLRGFGFSTTTPVSVSADTSLDSYLETSAPGPVVTAAASRAAPVAVADVTAQAASYGNLGSGFVDSISSFVPPPAPVNLGVSTPTQRDAPMTAPEPATLVLLGSGLAGAFALGRRRGEG